MAVFSFSGSKLYIGGAKSFRQSDFTTTDFTGEAWVQVNGIGTIGEYGDNAEYGSYPTLGDRRAGRFLTMFAGTDTVITMARNIADPGQTALRNAGRNPGTNYAIRIVYDDEPAGGTPSEDIFIALVGPLRRTGGGNTDALTWAATLAVNSNIVEIDAAVAPTP